MAIMLATRSLRPFWAGMTKVFDIADRNRVHGQRVRRDSEPPELYGTKCTDAERLANDWRVIGNDLRLAMNKFGEEYGIGKE